MAAESHVLVSERKYKLQVFEKKYSGKRLVLRRIRNCKNLYKEELHELHRAVIFRIVQSGQVQWTGNGTMMWDTRNAHRNSDAQISCERSTLTTRKVKRL
jgi:hypothetical protein